MPEWKVYIAHQNSVLVEIGPPYWGSARKWKTFEINKKVRMDSPSEFSATIEFDSEINFNDLIKFERDGTIEWMGFVEDLEIAWDENGRYLKLAGRDLTLLLWRKYVENFNNAISNTEGFFGNVNAAELIKFLLRTPRSDLPEVENDNVGELSVYPYNKEGWGLDITNFLGLDTLRNTEGYGDINATVLRKRDMLWANSGSPFESNNPATEGVVNGLYTTMNWYTPPAGISPYINIDGGPSPTSYIKSHTGVNDTAEFTFAPLDGSDDATAINSCYITIIQAPDGTWDWWDSSNCYVYVWVESWGIWCGIGNFGGRSSAHALYDLSALSWQNYVYDLSSILRTVDDVNNAKVRFVETGSLSTYIRYCTLSIGYVGSGNMKKGEWVNIMFNPVECMGVYIESREHPDQFPKRYHITTNGGLELFEGYTTFNESDSYITVDAALDTITFDSYQSNDASRVAYFYRQGISEAGGTGPIGDFDESISFSIASSQPCSVSTSPYNSPAFIPWCLANKIADFYTIENTVGTNGYFTCFDVINIEGTLYPQFRVQNSGGEQSLPASNTIALDTGVTYFLHIKRVGSTLTYGLYNAVTMRVSELVVPIQTFTCSDSYTYRYQGITYNHINWAEIFVAEMEGIGVGGEFFVNGDFETGDLTGWSGDIEINSDPAYVRTGNYSVKVNTDYGIITTTISRGAAKDSIVNAGFYVYGGGSTDGIYYLYYWDHSAEDYDAINWSASSAGWNYKDILPNLRNDGSQLQTIAIECNQPITYFDDFSLYIPVVWSSATGTATRITNTSKHKTGSSCQEIHCTADGQYFYFEKNLTDPEDTVRIDAWIRTPPPKIDSYVGGDVLAETYHLGSPAFETWGSAPYVRDSGDMDNNHLWFPATWTPVREFADYITFDALWNTSWGKDWYESIVNMTSNCKLHVSARILNNIGGTGSLLGVAIAAYLYVAHSNTWVQVGDSGTGWNLGPSWSDLFSDVEIDSYLTTWEDWYLARVKFTYYGYSGTSGDPSCAQFQIGQVKLIFDGDLSGGRVDVLKVYNSSVGIGTPAADIAVRASSYATSTGAMRYAMWGSGTYIINGMWGPSFPAGGTTGADFPVPIGSGVGDQWVRIRLYIHVENGGNGYVKLYNITSGSEVLLCKLEGLNNLSSGIPDRIRFEAEYWFNYGNNSSTFDTYLDTIEVFSLTETLTSGTIYAGAGPEQLLVGVGPDYSTPENFYPDIIHSWQVCPISGNSKISNLKIYADEPDNSDHGWEITQIYVYKTDPVKYRVVLDDCKLIPDEYKLTFDSGSYTDCANSDDELEVYHGSFDDKGPHYIGKLLDYDNDNYEWRVDVTNGNYIPIASDTIKLYTTNGGAGMGTGTLTGEAAKSVYSGGPYLYLDDANIDLSQYFSQDELIMIGPMNIPKNRLMDILWDICVQVNDDYTPFEWWISYPSTDPTGRCIGDFHIGSRKGSDKSATVSFTTGINMEGVKLQKSSRDTYQRCQLIGTGEGKNQDNCSSFWQNDQDAMDEIQGFIEDIITQKQVSGGRIANRYAKVKLKLDASPKRKNGIECTIGRDTYDSGTYDVGDDVAISDLFTELGPSDDNGGVYRIWNAKINGDDNGEKVVLTVQAPYLDISNVWKDVYGKLKQLGAMGTIATDWIGDGTQSGKVSADKLTTLFSKTAQNEETTPKDSSDPTWAKGTSIDPHGANWKGDSGNLSIWGGDNATEVGSIWVEARFNSSYTPSDTVNVNPDDTIDISMDQEPKFASTFKVIEPTGVGWNKDDYVDFGMFDQTKGKGFLVRVVCSSAHEFQAYAVFTSAYNDYYHLTLDELKSANKAKLLCNLKFNHKYKAIITVEYNGDQYGNPLPEVVISITDEEADNPPTYSAVFTKFNSPSMIGGSNAVFCNMTVRPIYIFASGKGGTPTYRCQMNFYEVKAERDVM